jgi:hypothetical protein
MRKLALATFMVLASDLIAQQSLADRLRKAVVEEDSQHNLTAAVQDYQAVVAQFDAGRKIAASALFRLAECYRQQGRKDEAVGAFQRVIREFGDQSGLSGKSRDILASVYKIYPSEEKPVRSTRQDQTSTAGQQHARQRYRQLLVEEIDVRDKEVSLLENRVKSGVESSLVLAEAKQQKLKLERDLAAFDMGIMPAVIESRRPE